MIDSGIQQPWPDAVREAATRFRQGDLIERPLIFYAADGEHGVWALTRVVGSPGGGVEIFELDSADGPPYGLITTQTCDIFEETPKPKQPWIQVAPVYNAALQLTADQQRMVVQDRVMHLIYLTAPTLPEGFWVADLRIELPMEKSLLVSQTALTAFADEGDYRKLARRLAGRRSRPAFAQVITDNVTGPLKKRIDGLKKGRQADLLAPVEELRLVVEGTSVNPSAVRLIIVMKEQASSGETEAFFGAWWTHAKGRATPANLQLLPNRITTLGVITALD